MVACRCIELVHGGYKPTYNWVGTTLYRCRQIFLVIHASQIHVLCVMLDVGFLQI